MVPHIIHVEDTLAQAVAMLDKNLGIPSPSHDRQWLFRFINGIVYKIQRCKNMTIPYRQIQHYKSLVHTDHVCIPDVWLISEVFSFQLT